MRDSDVFAANTGQRNSGNPVVDPRVNLGINSPVVANEPNDHSIPRLDTFLAEVTRDHNPVARLQVSSCFSAQSCGYLISDRLQGSIGVGVVVDEMAEVAKEAS